MSRTAPQLSEAQRANVVALCEALESGKYRKGCGLLREDNFYCCLGVACDISGLDPRRESRGWPVKDSSPTPPTAAREQDAPALDPALRVEVSVSTDIGKPTYASATGVAYAKDASELQHVCGLHGFAESGDTCPRCELSRRAEKDAHNQITARRIVDELNAAPARATHGSGETTPTPTPWTVGESTGVAELPAGTLIVGGPYEHKQAGIVNDCIICAVAPAYRRTAVDMANAELIVRTVNSHAALIAALKLARKYPANDRALIVQHGTHPIGDESTLDPGDRAEVQAIDADLAQIDAALAASP